MAKLICFDMDGVLFEGRNFWMEVHKAFGTYEEGKELTEKYMHTDYDRLVEEVVGRLWKGRDAGPYYQLVKSAEYLPGVREVFDELRRRNYLTAIISGSSIDLARRVQQDLGISRVFANELDIKDGKVSGRFVRTTGAGRHKKAESIRNLCRELNISPEEVIYVGDNEADIEAFRIAGKPIAFNSECEELNRMATHVVEGKDLRGIMQYID